jgi:hypothetical protein
MAASKIKKKSPATKATPIPRQAAIPCLVLIILALLVGAFFFFAGFHVA